MPKPRNTPGDTTADGLLDALESIEAKLVAMSADNDQRDADNATMITKLTNIEARLNAGLQVQVVTNL